MGRWKDLLSDEEYYSPSGEFSEEPVACEEYSYIIGKTYVDDNECELCFRAFTETTCAIDAIFIMSELLNLNYPDFFNAIDIRTGCQIEIIPTLCDASISKNISPYDF